jgi:ribose 5-phosphate isomerase A
MISVEEWDFVKNQIGQKAAELVPTEGVIGLGSGSTVAMFVKALAKRHAHEHLHILCVPASKRTELLARDYGLPVLDGNTWNCEITVAFDGADAVDSNGTAIKGAGGDLLREKIVISAAKRVILMVDERKWKLPLHQPKIPTVVVPFGWKITEKHIQSLGISTYLRSTSEGTPVITDDGMYILDLQIPKDRSLADTHHLLQQLPGIVDTGIFLTCCSSVLIGYKNGNVEEVAIQKT